MSLQGSLSIERMCELTRVSRASFYRSFREQHPVEAEMEVRSAIQQIAVEHRRRYLSVHHLRAAKWHRDAIPRRQDKHRGFTECYYSNRAQAGNAVRVRSAGDPGVRSRR